MLPEFSINNLSDSLLYLCIGKEILDQEYYVHIVIPISFSLLEDILNMAPIILRSVPNRDGPDTNAHAQSIT